MHQVIGTCPICQDQLEVTRLHCRSCDTTIEGHFALDRFAQLDYRQLEFIELFVRCEGKINRVCQELNLSYPVVRSQLTEVIEALGYTVGDEPADGLTEAERRDVLAKVSAGEISAEEAAKALRG